MKTNELVNILNMENIEFEKMIDSANKDSLAGNINNCIHLLEEIGFYLIENFIGDEEKTRPLGNWVFFGCNEYTENELSLVVLDDELAVKKLAFTGLESMVKNCVKEIYEE